MGKITKETVRIPLSPPLNPYWKRVLEDKPLRISADIAEYHNVLDEFLAEK